MLLLHGPTHSTRGDSKYLSQMLSLKLKPVDEDNPIRRWYTNTKYFLQDNWQRTWVLLLWIGVMLGLFAYKFVQYRREDAYEVMGHCVCMAKGFTQAYGVDYLETFALVAKMNTVRVILSLAANHDWDLQ